MKVFVGDHVLLCDIEAAPWPGPDGPALPTDRWLVTTIDGDKLQLVWDGNDEAGWIRRLHCGTQPVYEVTIGQVREVLGPTKKELASLASSFKGVTSELTKLADQWRETRERIRELNELMHALDEQCPKQFGAHVWLDATDRSPVTVKVSGTPEAGYNKIQEIRVHPGSGIGAVIEFLHDLAAERKREPAIFRLMRGASE